IEGDFEQFGLQVATLHVENISLPPEVEQALDKRTSMGIVGDLNKYTQFQVANSLEAAARNPAGAGPVMMGVGMTMANQAVAGSAAVTPPPLPQTNNYHVVRAGQQAGPVDVLKFPALIEAGQIGPQTLVWKPGMANWAPASAVPELAGLFQSAPPPIPQ